MSDEYDLVSEATLGGSSLVASQLMLQRLREPGLYTWITSTRILQVQQCIFRQLVPFIRTEDTLKENDQHITMSAYFRLLELVLELLGKPSPKRYACFHELKEKRANIFISF